MGFCLTSPPTFLPRPKRPPISWLGSNGVQPDRSVLWGKYCRINWKVLRRPVELAAVTGKVPHDYWTISLALFSFCAKLGSVQLSVSCAADPLPPFSFWGRPVHYSAKSFRMSRPRNTAFCRVLPVFLAPQPL